MTDYHSQYVRRMYADGYIVVLHNMEYTLSDALTCPLDWDQLVFEKNWNDKRWQAQ